MCPDKQVLSVYFDREIPSPWKEKIAAHVAGCHSCGRELARLERVRSFLHSEDSHVERKAAEMASDFSPLAALTRERRRRMPTVALPLAAAAAAACLLIGGAVGLILGAGRFQRAEFTHSLTKAQTIDVTVQVRDMKQLLEILNSQPTMRELTITLPETPVFDVRGEPVFLRAADMGRGTR